MSANLANVLDYLVLITILWILLCCNFHYFGGIGRFSVFVRNEIRTPAKKRVVIPRNGSDYPSYPDFEDKFPAPNTFAYIWYANGPEEMCSSLLAFQRILELRERHQNDLYHMLYFVRPEKGTESEHNFSYAQKTKFENIVYLSEMDHLGLIRNSLKYVAVQSRIFSRFILLDPKIVPLRNLDHLLFLDRNARIRNEGTVLAAPRAHDKIKNAMAEDGLFAEERPCFGRRSNMVDSDLMVMDAPGEINAQRLFARILPQKRKDTTKGQDDIQPILDDRKAVNYEYFCNDEIFELDQNYLRHDYEYLKGSKKKTQQAFSIKLSKFAQNYDDTELLYHKKDFKRLLKSWRKMTNSECNLL